eukprot:4551339-Pyramimonas_sp.AAC.1
MPPGRRGARCNHLGQGRSQVATDESCFGACWFLASCKCASSSSEFCTDGKGLAAVSEKLLEVVSGGRT